MGYICTTNHVSGIIFNIGIIYIWYNNIKNSKSPDPISNISSLSAPKDTEGSQ